MKRNDKIGIYVHIPFCVRKCAYCDFLSFSADRDTHNRYVNLLCKQIDETDDTRQVSSVYFGGGTPSVTDPELIGLIMDKIRSKFMILPEAEITIEVNPGTTTYKKLNSYVTSGFNRLSIGLQSANDDELKLINRIHTFDDFLATYNDARKAGFSNINVDVMTALPGQNEDKLNHTLDEVIKLNPEHVSAYSLILEEGTPFYEKYNDKPFMSSDEERRLYYLCRDRLKEAGYEHYEISNFAKPGLYSRHNTSYWKRQDYYGFGLGASSLIRGHRIKNESDMNKYLENPHILEEDITLHKKDRMEEYMFLGLRMMEGVDIEEFEKTFDADFERVYGPITAKLIAEGLLERLEKRVFLTDKGIDYGNYVFASFLL